MAHSGTDVASGDPAVYFEKNVGQFHPDAVVKARTPGYTFFLTPSEAVFVLGSDGPIVRMEFVGGDGNARIAGEGETRGKSNYLVGDEPDDWLTGISHYERVRMEDVWPGIDVVFQGTPQNTIQFDFHVHPGVDPGLIELDFQGGDPILEEDGSLLVSSGLEPLVRFPAPYTFQMPDHAKIEVESGFAFTREGHVAFDVASFDPDVLLVIDPAVEPVYSTYMNGQSRHIAVDDIGNMYITGRAFSTDFPTTEGALQESYPSVEVAYFVTKLHAGGSELVYSTYIGGAMGTTTRTEDIHAIAVDHEEQAIVAGHTSYEGMPVKNAFQNTNPGRYSGFVAKLTAEGDDLIYGTYLGGSGDDFLRDVAVDSDGNAYVTGMTRSSSFPTKNAYQEWERQRMAFVAKFDSGGGLDYSTLLGCSSIWSSCHSEAEAIAVDEDGHAYVTGWTWDFDFPTKNAFQFRHQGVETGFVTKFSTTGSSLVYSTFLGGDDSDIPKAIAVDDEGQAYVTGYTWSSNFPTKMAFQDDLPGDGWDSSAFVTKFYATGSSVVYSTYLGGTSRDFGFSVAVDAMGHAYIAGESSSPDYPTENAYLDEPTSSWENAFVTKIRPGGFKLVYSTFLGGTGESSSAGITVDSDDHAYITGTTRASDFPVTEDALHDERPQNGAVSFIVKLSPFGPATPPLGLSAAAGPGAGEITVGWSAPADDGGSPITGYDVYAADEAGGPFSKIGSTDNTTFALVESGLGNGQMRHYHVTATNAAGESAFSGPAAARTFRPPDPPRNLTVEAGPGAGELTLSWDVPFTDGGTPITGFIIYGADAAGGPFSQVATTGASTLELAEAGLVNNQTRYYEITAENIAGEGDASLEVNATTFREPDPPEGLSAEPGEEMGEVELSWRAPADDGGTPVSNYTVLRFGDDDWHTIAVMNASTTSYTDEDQSPVLESCYVVVASNIAGDGDPSAEACSTAGPLPGAPGVEEICNEHAPEPIASEVCGESG